ncbi:hypothetical protein O9929_26395 [Vibrio lentus]|nr:hypothetical protein [Vibrio lentus]
MSWGEDGDEISDALTSSPTFTVAPFSVNTPWATLVIVIWFNASPSISEYLKSRSGEHGVYLLKS